MEKAKAHFQPQESKGLKPKARKPWKSGGGTILFVWVKIKPPGYGPQVLVMGSIYQGNPFWGYPIFDPQPLVPTELANPQFLSH